MDIHPEVQQALAENKPVVALETALVTHGLPYPQNLQVSLSLEDIVRSTGSIPSTIGVVGGRIKVGLTKGELERLADEKARPAKISRRDIAPAIAIKADGGTTCSATLVFAALAGIKVFATGGLGGVHRGGENSMDISADLQELTRCPVGLVSSGVKSILDIGRTLEYLETLGVPVLTYGVTREFPAFFSRHSGHDAPWNVSDPITAAQILHTQWQLDMRNGALIAVPIPVEYEEIGMTIQKAVDQAVAEAEENGVSKRGKEATPWLLTRISELTKGESLESNIALLRNTASVGGEIAVQYQRLVNEEEKSTPVTYPTALPASKAEEGESLTTSQAPLHLAEAKHPPAKLIVVGSAAVDITAQAQAGVKNALIMHSTAPGTVSMSLGGVARNIAEAAHRVITLNSRELSSLLVSAIGDDHFGRLLTNETTGIGMRVDGLVKNDKQTPVCNMVLDSSGGLIGGITDMGGPRTATLDKDTIISYIDKHNPSLVALDANLSEGTIRHVVRHCIDKDIDLFFEPTSVIRSTAILPAISATLDTFNKTRAPIAFASPNLLELAQLEQASAEEPLELTSHPSWWSVIDSLSLGSDFRRDLERLASKSASDNDTSTGTLAFLLDQGVAQTMVKLLPFFQHLVVKCGAQGCLVGMRISERDAQPSPWAHKRSNPSQRYVIARGNAGELLVLQHFPALYIDKVVNVTGAGDSFVGVLLANLVRNPRTFQDPKTLSDAISAAQRAAILSLQSHSAVSPLLS